jgi:hypothetical protein
MRTSADRSLLGLSFCLYDEQNSIAQIRISFLFFDFNILF